MKLKDIFDELHSGDAIPASAIVSHGDYPVFGGNGLRGYTNKYNQDGKYVIIGRQGAYCGNARYHKGRAFLSEHAIVAKPNPEFDYTYLSEYLNLIDLSKFQGQSAQPGLSVKTISEIDINTIPGHDQARIGHLLRLIDEKIALNREINRNLLLAS